MNLSNKTCFLLILIVILAATIRLIWLDKYPSSLYSDEIDQGYNAYSLMLTGKDEHGVYMPVSLRSFGDWKPPLPSYFMIPFIRLIGLSEVSVRMPSALLGIITIILIFFLTMELFSDQEKRTKIALLSSFFLSISPWDILQSRAAMLVVTGLFFLVFGVYLFMKGLKNSKLLYLRELSFALSIYSYYGLRVVIPVILITLLFSFKKRLLGTLTHKDFLGLFILGCILLLPLLISFIKQPDVIFGRAKTVSIFYDQGINLRKWELITQDGINANPLITRLFHNNFYMYGRNILQRFLSHFDGRYLFMIGDTSQPFQIPNMGILNFTDLFFIPLGLLVIFKKNYASRWLIFCWIIAGILPSAFTFVTPSSNRTFNAIVIYSILVAVGTFYFARILSKRLLGIFVISLLYSLSFGYFLNQYFVELPINHADWWNYGWKQVVEMVKNKEDKYNNIIVPDVNGMPYIYFLFYEKYSPEEFQKRAIKTYIADRFGYEHVEGFGKYLFPNEFDWNFIKKNSLDKHALYIVPEDLAKSDTNYINAIYYPNGKIAFKIFAYE